MSKEKYHLIVDNKANWMKEITANEIMMVTVPVIVKDNKFYCKKVVCDKLLSLGSMMGSNSYLLEPGKEPVPMFLGFEIEIDEKEQYLYFGNKEHGLELVPVQNSTKQMNLNKRIEEFLALQLEKTEQYNG